MSLSPNFGNLTSERDKEKYQVGWGTGTGTTAWFGGNFISWLLGLEPVTLLEMVQDGTALALKGRSVLHLRPSRQLGRLSGEYL